MITLLPKDFMYLAPLGVLTVVGLLLILAEAFAISKSRTFLMQLTVAGCVMAMIAAVITWRSIDPGQ